MEISPREVLPPPDVLPEALLALGRLPSHLRRGDSRLRAFALLRGTSATPVAATAAEPCSSATSLLRRGRRVRDGPGWSHFRNFATLLHLARAAPERLIGSSGGGDGTFPP